MGVSPPGVDRLLPSRITALPVSWVRENGTRM